MNKEEEETLLDVKCKQNVQRRVYVRTEHRQSSQRNSYIDVSIFTGMHC